MHRKPPAYANPILGNPDELHIRRNLKAAMVARNANGVSGCWQR